MMGIVSLVKIDKQFSSVEAGIERALNLIDFKFPSSAKRIVIKPNLCYYWNYSTGETTDPHVVGSLVDLIRKRLSSQVDISIIESDASAMKCKYAYKMLGFERMAKEKGVSLVNLSEVTSKKTLVTVGNESFEFSVPETISSADLFINLPKVKYMHQVKISSSLKNIYGCNPLPKKYKYHKVLPEAIVGLNKIMKPDLTILDGLIVRGVSTVKLGMLMASVDPVSVDAASAQIASINPHSLSYLKLASKEQIGSIDYEIKGESLLAFQKNFPRKQIKHHIRGSLSKLYFKISA